LFRQDRTDDDWHVADDRIVSELPEDLPAVPTGHQDIQDNHLGMEFLSEDDRGLRRASLNQPIVAARQKTTKELGHVRIVVDHKNPHHRLGR
jgi:hypothetical protein